MGADIIIVDDDPGITRVVTMMLRTHDFNIRVADSIAKALELSKQTTPSLVITDMLMPGGTGIEFIENCREDPMLPKFPIICMTASGDNGMIERAMMAGAFACLAKPFSTSQLLDMVYLALQEQP